MGALIDGKAVAQAVRSEVGVEVAAFQRTHGYSPGLATVLVGDDPASEVYVRNKHKACGELGIASFAHHLPATTPQAELMRLVRELNERSDVHAILVQLPLPKH